MDGNGSRRPTSSSHQRSSESPRHSLESRLGAPTFHGPASGDRSLLALAKATGDAKVANMYT